MAGLPASMPRSMAMSMANNLFVTSRVLEQQSEAVEHEVIDWQALGFSSFEEMKAVTGWQALSLEAYWKYSVGQQLADLCGSHVVDGAEALLRRGE